MTNALPGPGRSRAVRGHRPTAPDVTLAVFDMKELGLIGARHTAEELSRGGVRGMVCLDSFGYFADEPGTQRLPAGFARAFPEAAAATRVDGYRGDFVLVVPRVLLGTAGYRSYDRGHCRTQQSALSPAD